MKIDDLKDLKKLIQLCQSQGVRTIEIDNIKLELNEVIRQPKRLRQIQDPGVNLTPNVDESIQIPQMDIPTDELSAEDLLFYSSDNAN